MKSGIKTITITKDTFEDLLELSEHALKKVLVEEYDVEFLLRCMVLVQSLEASFGEYSIASITREKFNEYLGVDDGTSNE